MPRCPADVLLEHLPCESVAEACQENGREADAHHTVQAEHGEVPPKRALVAAETNRGTRPDSRDDQHGMTPFGACRPSGQPAGQPPEGQSVQLAGIRSVSAETPGPKPEGR